MEEKMNDIQLYITQSMHLHLFSARIMKEHAIFLQAGFTSVNQDFSKEAKNFQHRFEELLQLVVQLSQNNNIHENSQNDDEVTSYTLEAEIQTQNYTGIVIDQNITKQQLKNIYPAGHSINERIFLQVQQINKQAEQLLTQYISYKESLIHHVQQCHIFTANYPLLLDHILREANKYYQNLLDIESGIDLSKKNQEEMERFWNQIMMEHALFIRGLLDPSEAKLIHLSNNFVRSYSQLLQNINQISPYLHNQSLEETMKLKEFKEAGTKGILNCQIKSIILPLLADHVLREANHYLQLLQK